MARFYVLDASPLMLACRARSVEHVRESARFVDWKARALEHGARFIVPAVADFEVRRKLLHLRDLKAVDRLDDVIGRMTNLDIAPGVMKTAAELWAAARSAGRSLGDDRELNADVILAAQVLRFAGAGDRVTVVTENRDHLALFVDAWSWKDLTP